MLTLQARQVTLRKKKREKKSSERHTNMSLSAGRRGVPAAVTCEAGRRAALPLRLPHHHFEHLATLAEVSLKEREMC